MNFHLSHWAARWRPLASLQHEAVKGHVQQHINDLDKDEGHQNAANAIF